MCQSIMWPCVYVCRRVCVLVRVDPPHFTCRPRPIYQRQPIQSVTMPCCADGDPMPIITWRKVGCNCWPRRLNPLHAHKTGPLRWLVLAVVTGEWAVLQWWNDLPAGRRDETGSNLHFTTWHCSIARVWRSGGHRKSERLRSQQSVGAEPR